MPAASVAVPAALVAVPAVSVGCLWAAAFAVNATEISDVVCHFAVVSAVEVCQQHCLISPG